MHYILYESEKDEVKMVQKKASASIHWLAIITIIFVMVSGFLIHRHRAYITEAMHLPFHEVNLQEVEDGLYSAKTYTSFLHLQLEVTVKDHVITDIKVIENAGYDGETARPIINKMIEENKIVVPAVKGAEIGSMVYISCVSTALSPQTKSENEGQNAED